jgi:maltose O-acetyltransferase
MNKLHDLFLNVVAGSRICPKRVRRAIYRMAGIKIGSADVWPGVEFRGTRCTIGDGSWINRGADFDCRSAEVWIGRSVGVAMGVLFVTSSHQLGPSDRRAGAIEYRPIRVEDGVWIGARAVILPGCTIGRGCVIAAGAVVTQDCAPDGLYGGVPARRIRNLA